MHLKRSLRIATLLIAAALIAPAAHSEANPDSAASSALTASLTAERAASAAAKSAAAAASSADAATAGDWIAPSPVLLYGVTFIAFLAMVIAIASIRGALGNTRWSLAEALSEEVPMPYYKETKNADGTTTRELVLDKEGKAILVPELKASTSRLIALMGMIAILFLFIGFGSFALFSFGSKGRLPDRMDEVVKFLVSGLTLFAPYLINKFTSIFQGIAGGK